MTIIINGFDHIEINGTTITSLSNEDAGKVTFPNDAMQLYKGGGSAVGFKADADVCDFELHIFRATEDDQFLAQLNHYQKTNTYYFTPLTAVIVKTYSGGIQEKMLLSNGFFTKSGPDLTSSFSGKVEAMQSLYKMRFANSDRAYV